MKVDESIGFDQYWKRFKRKQPDPHGGVMKKNGDNIYEPNGRGGYRQLPSAHSEPKFTNCENPKTKRRDLGGQHVLISRQFAYFGSEPKELPENLKDLIVGKGFRCKFPRQVKDRFVRFASRQGFGGYMHCPHWRKRDRIVENRCRHQV